MRYAVQVYISDGPGRFSGYEPGDRLYPVTTLHVEADTIEAALDRAYFVGNRMGPDANDREWPGYVRSVSVGDVMVIGARHYAVASFGFDVIDPSDVAWSVGILAARTPVDHRHPAGPPARSAADLAARRQESLA